MFVICLDVVGAKTISAIDLLVGTSRAERRMSRHAMRDVFDRNQLSQQPANCIADKVSLKETSRKSVMHQ